MVQRQFSTTSRHGRCDIEIEEVPLSFQVEKRREAGENVKSLCVNFWQTFDRPMGYPGIEYEGTT